MIAPEYEITEFTICSEESGGYNTCNKERWTFKALVFDNQTGIFFYVLCQPKFLMFLQRNETNLCGLCWR